MSQYKVVPVEADEKMCRAAMPRVGAGGWRDVYIAPKKSMFRRMIDAAPDTGMLAVSRADLDKLIHPDCYSFNEVAAARINLQRVIENGK